MQDKLSLIIFVMRDNPLLDKLSGSLVGNSPTSNESANGRIQLYPKLGWKTSCQLDTKLKMQETEKRKSLRHNLCRSWKSGFYACGQVGHKTAQVLSENQLRPKLGWSATVQLAPNSWWGVWNFISFDFTSGQFVQRYHQASIRKSKISLLQLSVKWKSVISCLFLNWE